MTAESTPHRLVDPRLVVRPDRRFVRAGGRSRRYLVIDVTAPTAAPDPSRRRAPVNLAFVLDRSGSMGGHQKLSLAKQAVIESIHRLDPKDRFAVVAYDDRVDVVMPGTTADAAARRDAVDRLEGIEARGSTHLHGGWITGCEQVAGRLAERGVNRVLLLTDGLANVGIQDADELARQAADLRGRGITTSTFGVGSDFDEALLQGMADAGGGHAYVATDVASMRDHITSEVGETLDVVARDVVVDLVLPAGVRAEPLTPFRLEQTGARARVHLGDMLSGQVLTIALRLEFDYGDVGRLLDLVVRLEDRDRAFELASPAIAPVVVGWEYADHATNDAQPRDAEVERVVARFDAQRARQEAVRLNREGRYGEASGLLRQAAVRVGQVAGDDAELQGLAAELGASEASFAAPMPEMARKAAYARSSLALRSRTEDGRSRKA